MDHVPFSMWCSVQQEMPTMSPRNCLCSVLRLMLKNTWPPNWMRCRSLGRCCDLSFFDNFDDAVTYNPLRKGVVKFLTYPDVKVKFIASEDIGKGCAILLTNPTEYSGKVIEAPGAEHSGTEIAKALSEVSGTACKYKVAVPRFVMWLLMGDVYHMTKWIEKVGYSTDIEAFKKIVPDAQDAHAFFREKGQWANGEKFVSG